MKKKTENEHHKWWYVMPKKKWWDDVKVENITMKSEKWGLNMYVRSKTHDVSNHSKQTLQGPQPGVIGKWSDERKDYMLVWGSMG